MMQTLGARKLRLRDFFFCLHLARDGTVRSSSLNPKPPSVWGHFRWMCTWMWGRGRRAWIIERFSGSDWERLGLLRAARGEDGSSEVSIAITKAWRGRGVASHVLTAMAPIIAVNVGKPILARIKRDNAASIRAFTKAGFGDAGLSENGSHSEILSLYWG